MDIPPHDRIVNEHKIFLLVQTNQLEEGVAMKPSLMHVVFWFLKLTMKRKNKNPSHPQSKVQTRFFKSDSEPYFLHGFSYYSDGLFRNAGSYLMGLLTTQTHAAVRLPNRYGFGLIDISETVFIQQRN